MKKTFAFLLTLFIILSIPVSCFATYYSGDKTSAWVNGEFKSLILNEYFRNNYDSLLEYNYSVTKEHTCTDIVLDNIGFSNDAADGYYIMIVFNESIRQKEQSYSDFNSTMLDSIKDLIKDTVYIGNTTPCAIVLIAADINTARLILNKENVIGVYDAFNEEITMICWEISYEPHKQGLTAADARTVLRVAAGLEEIKINKKAFYCYYDFNSNNKIDAGDARLILRACAGLDIPRTFISDNISDWLTDPSGGIKGF